MQYVQRKLQRSVTEIRRSRRAGPRVSRRPGRPSNAVAGGSLWERWGLHESILRRLAEPRPARADCGGLGSVWYLLGRDGGTSSRMRARTSLADHRCSTRTRHVAGPRREEQHRWRSTEQRSGFRLPWARSPVNLHGPGCPRKPPIRPPKKPPMARQPGPRDTSTTTSDPRSARVAHVDRDCRAPAADGRSATEAEGPYPPRPPLTQPRHARQGPDATPSPRRRSRSRHARRRPDRQGRSRFARYAEAAEGPRRGHPRRVGRGRCRDPRASPTRTWPASGTGRRPRWPASRKRPRTGSPPSAAAWSLRSTSTQRASSIASSSSTLP